MLVASCCQVLEHSWLTRLFSKASDSHSGLLLADLPSESSCSVPFLSWDAHREIFPHTNKQQNQVWHQLPFHIAPLDGCMALPAFTHVEGSLPFYYKHIHLTTRRAVSIKCPPFVFTLFTVLDSKEPLALFPK